MVREISNKLVKARKDHLCETCETVAVKAGEEYLRVVLLNEDANELYNWVQCEGCLSANKYVREHNYENVVSFDDFSEWALECSQLKDDEGDAARAWEVRIASR